MCCAADTAEGGSACFARSRAPTLPAAPKTLAIYLAAGARRGLKVATLSQAIAAIASQHEEAGFDGPHGARLVKRVWKGIRRTCGTAPRQVAPTTVEVLRALSAALPDSRIGVRDRALLVVGFGAARRRSELVALDLDDVCFKPNGLIVRVRRSKTDQDGEGNDVGLRAGDNPLTCPVRTLRAWLQAGPITEGALFRNINRHGHLGARLTPAAVDRIIKRAAVVAGIDPTEYAGHSLRAGLATVAGAAGKSDRRIAQQGGWGSREMVDRYVRLATLLDDDNPTANIGL
jgi:integrase